MGSLKLEKLYHKLREFLDDKGLSHAIYLDETGQIKIVGVNKSQVKDAIKSITELEFKTDKDFKRYSDTHTLRPSTKVTIAGKKTTAGQATKSDAASIPSSALARVGKTNNLSGNSKKIQQWVSDTKGKKEYQIAQLLLKGTRDPDEVLNIKPANYDVLLKRLVRLSSDSSIESKLNRSDYNTHDLEKWATQSLKRIFSKNEMTGLSLPGGAINGAPDEDDVTLTKSILNKSNNSMTTVKEMTKSEVSKNFKVGDKVKFKAGGKTQIDTISKVDGIYLKLKRGGSIPYQSVIEENITEASTKPQMAKFGKDIYVDTTFVQHSNKFGELKHIGMGDFVVKTNAGNVSFDRINYSSEKSDKNIKYDQLQGFSGRLHHLRGDTKAIATLIKNIKPNVVKESVNESSGALSSKWRSNNKKGFVLKVGDISLTSAGPGGVHTIEKGGKLYGSFFLDRDATEDWWVHPKKGNHFYVKNIDELVKKVKLQKLTNSKDVTEAKVVVHNKKTGERYEVLSGSGKGDVLIAMKALQKAAPSHMTYSIKESAHENDEDELEVNGNPYKVEEVIMLDKSIKAEILKSISMGFDTIQVGKITPSRRGVVLVNDRYQVRGTYPLEYQKIIQSLIDTHKNESTTRDAKLKEIAASLQEDDEYKTFFKAALEKAGKSIPDMSNDEKKSFFNKIDAAWQGKGEKKTEGNAFGAAVSDTKENDSVA